MEALHVVERETGCGERCFGVTGRRDTNAESGFPDSAFAASCTVNLARFVSRHRGRSELILYGDVNREVQLGVPSLDDQRRGNVAATLV